MPKHRCPECGDERHLYLLGADVRWNPDTSTWDTTGDYNGIECTECDWTGELEETEVVDAD